MGAANSSAGKIRGCADYLDREASGSRRAVSVRKPQSRECPGVGVSVSPSLLAYSETGNNVAWRVSERWLPQGNPWDFPREGLACSACLLSCASAPVCLRSWLTWLSYANRASLAMTGSQRACWGCPLHLPRFQTDGLRQQRMIDLGYSQPDECGKRQKVGGPDVLSPREYDPERLMRFAFRSS